VAELIAQHGVSYHLFADDSSCILPFLATRYRSPDVLRLCSAGPVRVSSVAAERLKDGTDLVRYPDIAATAIVRRPRNLITINSVESAYRVM